VSEPERKLTAQGRERKQQLLDHAAELFAQRGYAETRVIDIVRAAGVAKGLFYWYFENKEALFRELVENIRLRLRQEQAAAMDPEADPLTRIRQGAEASVRFMAENARYFAMLASASADALIACWDAKFFYNFWRPVTAIRAGDSDGNPETTSDPAWIGLVVTPNHPEYPAAHGCFSGASTETLKYFFGTDDVGFWIDSNVAGLMNPVRTYFRFSDALTEVAEARIYGGMHYRNSTRIGANMGKQVSRFTTRHFFRPSRRDGGHPNP